MRIEVRASAVNYPDVMCVNGLYPTMPDYPFVPGFEVAGVVVETAAGVTSLAVGDEVVAMTGQLLGGHAPFVNVPAGQVVRKPRNVTFEQACSLPVCFSTVYTAFELGRLQARERVLIQTATGGCGLVAIQLAKLRGCEVFATSSKTHKRQILETLGASFVTDYREAFDREIRSATAGRGVDLVLNMVSGPAMQRGLNSLAPSGRYVELAVHAQRTGKPLDLSRLVDNQSFHSLDMRRLGARSSDNEDVGRVLRLMVEMVEAGQLEPIASRIYPLGLIREALELVAAGEHVGKIVISHTATAIQDCEAACLEGIRAQGRRAGASPSGAQLSGPLAASLATDAPRRAHEPVAIIGVAGQFPKSPDLGVFWDNLKHGENCVGDPPFARWGVNLDADGRPVSGGPPIYPHLGALEDAECFDPTFFNISPKEARLMDPQQRVFLQNCWTCIEEAGYAPSSLSGSRCGVYVGCAQSDYLQQAREAPGVHALMGASSSVLAARISYLLDLKGPCLAIDTACSSALVAISEACTSVATGNCDLALAGGVVVLSSSAFSQTLTDAGMLSPDGRCHTFDRSANGFVPCEGVGVVLLKRLSDALRDNDRIQGVIAGWGVNHDGKTNGMTAPSVVSQTALEREVHRRFGIDAATISYIEAHGTGTNLGDPIEVEGLIEAFRGAGAAPGSCALGSVKSNIGHALCAAGVAGVLKVVLALKHGQLPPTINYDTLNPEISLEGSPFYVNRALADWPGKPRRAAVNSFSYNGTNAHVVIETGPEPAARRLVATPADGHVAVLSARSEDQLQAYARLLLTHVRSTAQACHADDEAATLRDLVFTLQVGRDPLAERLAMVVGSLDDLEGKLTAYLSGQPLPAGLHRANAVEARRTAGLAQLSREERAGRMAAALAAGNQPALIAAWLAGEAVDWKRLHAGCDVRRVAAPTYPFERKRYWIYDQEAPVQPAAPAPPAPAADVRFAQLLTTVTR
ncbi:MAG TPA: beta-ketoacyl synthase N-terminal-like domain-containing protein [Phenylobacterium sp.]|uniref:beta-ketoacyl synthase N-terminal-like domain-containing protein n=1 Tax=Phenylobacterium sp. TaxID=1871053 RepID=UPI002D429159|nr:beta-ketoacyl synthase N-terminal-like domain-containing protein [Phenylobacterium sp.]HZZ67813.1 beta-ketoacyl synthase N-terminal-like domain-containing protein [Phenylobacterium sp.]